MSNLPRVLIVSRRTTRKNKYVDFVGEYHLDLVLQHGAVPVIVPRVQGVHTILESFEPIHGVLLCEGEDIDPSLYDDLSNLSAEALEEIKTLHQSDSIVDAEKDQIEMKLARLCLERGVPYLGICRGSQVLNVAAGGALYRDVESELKGTTKHMDYENYDSHRHPVEIVEGTPLHGWFKSKEILVNSYHHQGVKRLAARFAPMAYSDDGLVEGFYDPMQYDPCEGKFFMGLQFHPERMRKLGTDEFDYAACSKPYEEFVRASAVYMRRLSGGVSRKREVVMEEPGRELSDRQEMRLKQIGATVRNSDMYVRKMKVDKERDIAAMKVMGKMSVEQLSKILCFYKSMDTICSQVLDGKLNGIIKDI